MNTASPLQAAPEKIDMQRLLNATGKQVKFNLTYQLPYKPENGTLAVIGIGKSPSKMNEFGLADNMTIISFSFLFNSTILSLYLKDGEVLHAQVIEGRQELLPFKPPYIEAHIVFDGIDLGKFLRK